VKTVLIVDDELAIRETMEQILNYDGYAVQKAASGAEALAQVEKSLPDAILLDIKMAGMDGFEVLKNLSGSNMPDIIFVTAYDEFALRAFDANALDYLLKPINDDRLSEAIERVRKHREARRADEQRNKLLKFVCELTGRELTLDSALQAANSEQHSYPTRIAIRDGSETNCVDVESIDWVDAAGDYMCVHSDGDTFVLRGTMKHLENLLDPETFVRVHRSAIVNRHRVTAMRPHRNGEYFLQLGNATELKLSRKYKGNLERLANQV